MRWTKEPKRSAWFATYGDFRCLIVRIPAGPYINTYAWLITLASDEDFQIHSKVGKGQPSLKEAKARVKTVAERVQRVWNEAL